MMIDLNVNGTTVFGRCVMLLILKKYNSLTPLRMVADLLDASFSGQLPIVSNPRLSSDIANGIPAF